MNHREGGVIVKKPGFEIEDQGDAEAGHDDERRQGEPAMRRHHGNAAGAAQVVGSQNAKDQEPATDQPGTRQHQAMPGQAHAQRHCRDAGRHQPEAQTRRPVARHRAAGDHGQKLIAGADRCHREHAEGDEMDRRQGQAGAAAKQRHIFGAEQQNRPGQHMKQRGTKEEAERDRGGQEPVLGAAEKTVGHAHGRRLNTRRTSPGSRWR